MINRSPVVTAPEKYRTRGIFTLFLPCAGLPKGNDKAEEIEI
jgi:hypothetical protein